LSDTAAARYDRIAQLLIPGYSSLARLGVALLATSPLGATPGASILVAGCGTGAELLEARRQRPDWRLTAIDPSPAMLAAARERLASEPGLSVEGSRGQGNRGEGSGSEGIRWQDTRLEDLDPTTGFDGALAVLVLQGLPDDGSKLRFLTALARSLRPGGQVLLVDLMQGEKSALQDQLAAARLAFQRAAGPLDGETNANDEPLRGLTEAVHPIGSSRLAALVEAAGFSDPAPVFRALDYEGVLLQRLE
jgi:tRNA (cmo5U34)-methyltransferase